MSTAPNSERSALPEQYRASRSERLLAPAHPRRCRLRPADRPAGGHHGLNPSFGEPSSFIRFVGRTAPIAIAAIGQYFVIVGGEFDLSMGSVVTTQVIVAGNLIGQDDSRSSPCWS